MKPSFPLNNKARFLNQKVKVLIIISCGENGSERVAKIQFVNFMSCCTYNGNTVFRKKRVIISKCLCLFGTSETWDPDFPSKLVTNFSHTFYKFFH